MCSWSPQGGAEWALPGTRREPGRLMELGPGEVDQELSTEPVPPPRVHYEVEPYS